MGTFCDYKIFQKHRKWMETKENSKSLKDAAIPIFLKIQGFLQVLSPPKVKLG